MKVAFVGAGIYEKIPEDKRNRSPNAMYYCEALLKQNIESVYYIPVRSIGKQEILYHKDKKCYTVYIPCSHPLINRYFGETINSSLLLRRTMDFFSMLHYLIQVLFRCSQDKIDVYIILHLWTGITVFLNPILMIFRPVAILFMGGSLLIHKEFGWLFHILLAFYKLVLSKPIILTPIDMEEKICLFKMLKVPKRNVRFFNPTCRNEKEFYEKNKEDCVKAVGFDATKINMLALCRIQDPAVIRRRRSSDYERNIFLALETFRCLAQGNSMVHLHITGRGKGVKKLESKISQYDLQDRVTFHSWIPQELLAVYINAADIIINPSPLNEFNDTGAIFEAFLCGKPVVTYKRYPWVPTEQKGGFFINKDPEKGAQQILSRLSLPYLAKKSKEAKRIPYKHNIPMELWSKRLSEILTEFLREHA